MVGVAYGSLQADWQPESFGLVWGSAAAWRRAIFITWTGWTLAVDLSYDDSTINIVVIIIIIIIINIKPFNGVRSLVQGCSTYQ